MLTAAATAAQGEAPEFFVIACIGAVVVDALLCLIDLLR